LPGKFSQSVQKSKYFAAIFASRIIANTSILIASRYIIIPIAFILIASSFILITIAFVLIASRYFTITIASIPIKAKSRLEPDGRRYGRNYRGKRN
jgi:hypothetical protein